MLFGHGAAPFSGTAMETTSGLMTAAMWGAFRMMRSTDLMDNTSARSRAIIG